MKKCYVVYSSFDEYGCYDSHLVTECVCSNPFLAENIKLETEKRYKSELVLFPFNYCTEEEFTKNISNGKCSDYKLE